MVHQLKHREINKSLRMQSKPTTFSFFFFQAEDGIRDLIVTGVQTCALPIYPRIDLERTVQMTSARFDAERANTVLTDLISQARAALAQQNYAGEVVVSTSLELRYLGQNYELELPFKFDHFDAANQDSLWAEFHALHDSRYGFSISKEVIEVITFKCTAIVRRPPPAPPPLAARSGAAQPSASRQVWFDSGPLDTPVYRRDELPAGQVIRGPALVEESASVTVVRPQHQLSVSTAGYLLLSQATESEKTT